MSRRTSYSPRLTGVTSNDELQKFINLGKISASLLHEISNPLTAALLTLEQVSDETGKISSVRTSLNHLSAYVNAARQQLRSESSEQCFEVSKQIRSVGYLLKPVSRKHHVRLIMPHMQRAMIYGDPIKFQQIILNLVVNAIESYMEVERSHNRIIKVAVVKAEKQLTLSVIDYGCGIPKSQISHIFDKFFTTKSSQAQGIGLGLYLVKQNVEKQFNGQISVSSRQGVGSQFKVTIPISTRK